MPESSQEMERFLVSVERRAFRMARIATGNTEDALDIVQDAMLGLVRRYAVRPEDEWKALFYRILQNGIYDWGRRRSVRSRWLVRLKDLYHGDGEDRSDPIAALADPTAEGPADEVAVAGSISALDSALKTLPQRQQQVFLLRAWEGMGVRETAGVMGCSEGTVKTLYSRAVHTLRNMLEDYRP